VDGRIDRINGRTDGRTDGRTGKTRNAAYPDGRIKCRAMRLCSDAVSSTLSQQVRAVRALLTSMAAGIADDLYGSSLTAYMQLIISSCHAFFDLAPRPH